MAQYTYDMEAGTTDSSPPTGWSERNAVNDFAAFLRASGLPTGTLGSKAIEMVKAATSPPGVHCTLSFDAPGVVSGAVEVLAHILLEDVDLVDEQGGVCCHIAGADFSEDLYWSLVYSSGANRSLEEWDNHNYESHGGSALGTAYVDNVYHWVRLGFDGTGIYVKDWTGDYEDEPVSNFLADTSESSVTQGRPGLCLRGFGNSNSVSWWCDFFSVGTGGDPAPGPSAAATTRRHGLTLLGVG